MIIEGIIVCVRKFDGNMNEMGDDNYDNNQDEDNILTYEILVSTKDKDEFIFETDDNRFENLDGYKIKIEIDK